MSLPARRRRKATTAATSPAEASTRETGRNNINLDFEEITKEIPGPSSRGIRDMQIKDITGIGEAGVVRKAGGTSGDIYVVPNAHARVNDHDTSDSEIIEVERGSQEEDSNSSSSGDEYKYSPLRRKPPGPNGTPPPTFAEICKSKGIPLTLMRKRCRQYVREGYTNIWWDTFVPPPQFKDEIFEELSQTPPKDPKLDISPAYHLSKKVPNKKTVNKAEAMERERLGAIELLKSFAEHKQKRIQYYKELGIPYPYTSPRSEPEVGVAVTPKESPEFPDDSFNDELLLEYSDAVENLYNSTRLNAEAMGSANRENESSELVPRRNNIGLTSKKGLLQEIVAPAPEDLASSSRSMRSKGQKQNREPTTKSAAAAAETPRSSSRRRYVQTTHNERTKRIKLPSPLRGLPQPRQLNFAARSWTGNEFDDDDLLLSQIEIPGEIPNSQIREKLTEGEGFDESDADDELFSQIDC